MKEAFDLNFDNTEIAFSNKSNDDLRNTHRLFGLMKNQTLVNISSKIGYLAVKYNLPFARKIAKATIFKQFVGGETLRDCQDLINELYKYNSLTVLDYGAEAKSDEEDLDNAKLEFIKGVEYAAVNNSVPIVVVKLSGLGDDDMLRKYMLQEHKHDADVKEQYQKLINRLKEICDKAAELKVGLFLDAEESWVQDTIDHIADNLMEQYNKERVTVYNTYQLYRHDKLAYLKESYEKAEANGYLLGAKLVRGAYMDKENKRALEMGYISPIHKSKSATDQDYDEALLYCLDRYERVSFCCASHNMKSSSLLASQIDERNLAKTHPHLNFCQLYGMSDYITFNLAEQGYHVAKYLPYGPITDVIPYLIRRAQENSSVTGEMGRELRYISKEMKRRGL